MERTGWSEIGVAKLVERLVRKRLQYFIEKWQLLRHEQAGYRTCRSCEEQLEYELKMTSRALHAALYIIGGERKGGGVVLRSGETPFQVTRARALQRD